MGALSNGADGHVFSLSKLCDAMDFFEPEVIDVIQRVGEVPRFHCKQWEYAQVLLAAKHFAPIGGTFVGLGCGCEVTIPLLAEFADEVVATDLYGMPGAWKTTSVRPDDRWPELENLRVHSMNMRNIDLPQQSADFLWSMCAIEHVGSVDEIVDVVRRAGQLLADEGVMFITTEWTFGARPFIEPGVSSGTVMLDRSTVRRLFTETDLHLALPIDLRVTEHPMNVPVWEKLNNKGLVNIPHIWYRKQRPLHGTFGTCISIALCREDRGCDRFIDDPDQRRKTAPLFRLGRHVNRKLAPLYRWW